MAFMKNVKTILTSESILDSLDVSFTINGTLFLTNRLLQSLAQQMSIITDYFWAYRLANKKVRRDCDQLKEDVPSRDKTLKTQVT
ncbi:unnamed protein product [Ilex paraguariensis]|uniref:Uncharacterized protein n=1 Tax=Ilex paraguariensis TaxID=185542 RepID=A0ABC8TC23_9AQUA